MRHLFVLGLRLLLHNCILSVKSVQWSKCVEMPNIWDEIGIFFIVLKNTFTFTQQKWLCVWRRHMACAFWPPAFSMGGSWRIAECIQTFRGGGNKASSSKWVQQLSEKVQWEMATRMTSLKSLFFFSFSFLWTNEFCFYSLFLGYNLTYYQNSTCFAWWLGLEVFSTRCHSVMRLKWRPLNMDLDLSFSLCCLCNYWCNEVPGMWQDWTPCPCMSN